MLQYPAVMRERGEKREEREITHRARTSGDHTPFLYFLVSMAEPSLRCSQSNK